MSDLFFISNKILFSLPNSNMFSSSISRFRRLFAFSIVHIAMSTAAKPPLGDEPPINPSTRRKLSEAIV